MFLSSVDFPPLLDTISALGILVMAKYEEARESNSQSLTSSKVHLKCHTMVHAAVQPFPEPRGTARNFESILNRVGYVP